MRIAVVLGPFMSVPPAESGAVEKVWAGLVPELTALGHTVTVVAKEADEAVKGSKLPGAMRWVRGFERSGNILWDVVLDCVYSVRVFKILPPSDIVVTNTFWMPLLLTMCSRARTVIWVNVDRKPRGHLRLYWKACRFRVPSHDMLQFIPKWPRNLREKAVVVPNGIEYQCFDGEPIRSESLAPIILFAGRIHPEKGVHLLAAAYKIVRERGVQCSLQLVGSSNSELGGGGLQYLEEVRNAAMPFPVEEVGYVADKVHFAQLMKRATIFAYPSARDSGESFGVAPLEAMAAGCVPIVSKLGCFTEFIVDGKNGFTVDVDCVGAARSLAVAIENALSQPEHLRLLSIEARVTASRFCMAAVADQFAREFQRAVNCRV